MGRPHSFRASPSRSGTLQTLDRDETRGESVNSFLQRAIEVQSDDDMPSPTATDTHARLANRRACWLQRRAGIGWSKALTGR